MWKMRVFAWLGVAECEPERGTCSGGGDFGHPVWSRTLMFSRLIRAGTPTAMLRGGTDRMTTALAPMTEPSPIVISPSILAPVEMNTSSPILGTFGHSFLPPMVTPFETNTFLPILTLG